MSNHIAQQPRNTTIGSIANRCFPEQNRDFARDEQSPDAAPASSFDLIANTNGTQQEQRAQHAMQGYVAGVDRAARGEWRDPHHPLQKVALNGKQIAITPPERSFNIFGQSLAHTGDIAA